MDRFKSPVIESDKHLLRVMKYIDLNPVRANIVKKPEKYHYSSYKHYALGVQDPLITNSPAFLDLGETDYERQSIYKAMVEEIINNEELLNKKENYSIKFFIGDPEWVTDKYNKLKNNTVIEKKMINNSS